MKLFEIITPITTTKTENDYKVSNDLEHPSFLGSGIYSTVFDKNDDTDPNMVIKRNRTNVEHDLDGFVVYAEEIYQKELWNNPHFPRIYKTTKILSDGKTYLEWEIEKLHDITTLRDSHMDALIEKYFDMTNRYVSEVVEDKFYYYSTSCQKLIALLIMIFEAKVPKLELIKHEPLLEAINILIHVEKHKKLTFDIHNGNIMFRYSGSGGEIVFTDPFV